MIEISILNIFLTGYIFLIIGIFLGFECGYATSLYYNDPQTLTGKDAERFEKRMEEVNQGMHKVSDEDYERGKKFYEDTE